MLGLFKVIQCQRSWCQSKAHSWFPIWPPMLRLTLYLSCYSRYLMRKFGDLDLGRFKVIQCQRSWCQSIAHGWLSVRFLLSPTSYLSPFLNDWPVNFGDLELGQFKIIQGQKTQLVTSTQSSNTSEQSRPLMCLKTFRRYGRSWRICSQSPPVSKTNYFTPVCWAPWHQSMSTYSQPSFSSFTWKRGGVCM